MPESEQIKSILLSPSSKIREAIKILDSGLYIALVIDSSQSLIGTITDGDLRRGFLKGLTLDDTVDLIMNKKPRSVQVGTERSKILKLMKSSHLKQIPIIDEFKRVVGLEIFEELANATEVDSPVVLMAGGLGSRLGDLTKEIPKPLLKIGNKPIIETIIENFYESGFRTFYLSINYKAELFKDYLGDGSKYGVNIHYIHETERLGTAGSLSLLPPMHAPFIVMNADLLTKINFLQLLDFHQQEKSFGTMCVREYDIQVPYGVATIDNNRICSIDEKPIHRFYVNAGIYVLNQEAPAMIKSKNYLDMTTLFGQMIAEKKTTAAFPLREYWLDIGNVDDFSRAQFDFKNYFK